MNTPDYSEYKTTIQLAHLGEGYSAEERQDIAEAIEMALVKRFPGLQVEISKIEGFTTPTDGPEKDVIHDIDDHQAAAYADYLIAKEGQ